MKWKCWISLILSILLLSSCAVADEETTAPTQVSGPYGLEHYTQWIGHPAQEAKNALGTDQTVEFMGLSFTRSLLTEGDLFSGIELTTQLNDADGQVAATVWDLVQGMYKEYITVEISHQNMHSDAEHFALMEEREYYSNLEKALEKRGAYIFDISWNLNRRDYMTDEISALLDQLGACVLEETEQQFRDSTIDFIWSVNPRLDLLLEVTIWDANRADVKITYRALAEPAAGMDLDISRRSDRYNKFCQVAYERLLEEDNLFVLGYGFQTTESVTARTWEEIYLHGDDFLYIVDIGHSQKIFLQVDGVQYKTVYRNGEYVPWEVLNEAITHPLPWKETTVEVVENGYNGGGFGGNMYRNAFEGSFGLDYDGIKAEFETRANCIYKAEYRTSEAPVIDGDYLITDYRRVLDIEIVTEQEAIAAIEEYKAMLP
jgi:hypothetical protein